MGQLARIRVQIEEALRRRTTFREWFDGDEDEDDAVSLEDYLVGQEGNQRAYFFPGISDETRQILHTELGLDAPKTNKPYAVLQIGNDVQIEFPREPRSPIYLSSGDNSTVNPSLIRKLSRYYPTEVTKQGKWDLLGTVSIGGNKLSVAVLKSKIESEEDAVQYARGLFIKIAVAGKVSSFDIQKAGIGFFQNRGILNSSSNRVVCFPWWIRSSSNGVNSDPQSFYLLDLDSKHIVSDLTDLIGLCVNEGNTGIGVTNVFSGISSLISILDLKPDLEFKITNALKRANTAKESFTGKVESYKFYVPNDQTVDAFKLYMEIYNKYWSSVPIISGAAYVEYPDYGTERFYPICIMIPTTDRFRACREALSKNYISLGNIKRFEDASIDDPYKKLAKLWVDVLSNPVDEHSSGKFYCCQISKDTILFANPSSYIVVQDGSVISSSSGYEESKSMIYTYYGKTGLKFIYDQATKAGMQLQGVLKTAVEEYLGLVPKDTTLSIPKLMQKLERENRLSSITVPLYTPKNKKEPIKFTADAAFEWSDVAKSLEKSSPAIFNSVQDYAANNYSVKVYIQGTDADWNAAITVKDSDGKLVVLYRRTGWGAGLTWKSKSFDN